LFIVPDFDVVVVVFAGRWTNPMRVVDSIILNDYILSAIHDGREHR